MKHPPSLSSPRDFRRVMTGGRAIRQSWGTIHLLEATPPSSPSRLGLAVPARAGGAVQRNRIKRRVRAAFRLAAPTQGFDVVVRARAGAATVGFQELESGLKGLRV